MTYGMNSHNKLLNKLDTLDSEVDINQLYETIKKMHVQPITKKEYDELDKEFDENIGASHLNSRFKFLHLFRSRSKYLEFYQEITKLDDEQEEDFF